MGQEEWLRWAARRDHQIAAEYGPLSLTVLHWLSHDDVSFPGIPGQWRSSDEGIVVTATARAGITLGDDIIDGTVTVSTEADIRVWVGNVIIELIERGGSHAIRVLDPKAPARLAFETLPRFDFDRSWTIEADFTAADETQSMRIGSVVNGIEHDQPIGGHATFTIDGVAHRVVLFGEPGALWLLFKDTTNGVTTSGSARSLLVGAPDANGRIVLDFNRATCMPCAFNDYSTCPVPPSENRLPFAVSAGERKL